MASEGDTGSSTSCPTRLACGAGVSMVCIFFDLNSAFDLLSQNLLLDTERASQRPSCQSLVTASDFLARVAVDPLARLSI